MTPLIQALSPPDRKFQSDLASSTPHQLSLTVASFPAHGIRGCCQANVRGFGAFILQ